MEDDDWQMVGALAQRARAGELDAFLAQGDGCAWCRNPVRLRGAWVGLDGDRVPFTTGSLPDGVLLKACGNRRETRCPACAARYRGDARHLIRAGLLGGKGVDASISSHPAVLLTLTAPGFGPVHRSRRSGAPCNPWPPRRRCAHQRPQSCLLRHGPDDAAVGSPLCPECYDYRSAVLQNAATPELWRRTTIYTDRHLAAALGLTLTASRAVLRLSFCRVAEFQRRGLIHLHAVIRSDGSAGGTSPVTAEQLATACLRAARAVRVPYPCGTALWGNELDCQILDTAGAAASRVASYVSKYATKSSDACGALDRPICSGEDLASRELSDHARRMVTTAWDLGLDAELKRFKLRPHAHTFGYSGHFLSKSRRYSTTFGALQAERAAWRHRRRYGSEPGPDWSKSAHWQLVGTGWANQGERLFAQARRRNREQEIEAANEDRYGT